MGFALLYWILMLIWLVFGMWSNWPTGPTANTPHNYRPVGGTLLLFILLVILGWKEFGAPVHP